VSVPGRIVDVEPHRESGAGANRPAGDASAAEPGQHSSTAA
jgi:hypothetical protein